MTRLTAQELMENMSKIEKTSIKARATVKLSILNSKVWNDFSELNAEVDSQIDEFAERASYDFDQLFFIAQDREQENATRTMAIAGLTLVKVLDNKFITRSI